MPPVPYDRWMVVSLLVFAAFGVLTGLTTVLFGFGGGFVIVPVVYAVAVASGGSGEAMLVAVATSTAVMIVNSLSASFAHWRSGRLRIDMLHPLAAYIGFGALMGAVAARVVPDGLLHLVFIAYLAITIIDSVLRRGFITHSASAPERRLGPWTTSLGGTGIGAVSSFLGVGGSIMTVPLLRRLGLPSTPSRCPPPWARCPRYIWAISICWRQRVCWPDPCRRFSSPNAW